MQFLELSGLLLAVVEMVVSMHLQEHQALIHDSLQMEKLALALLA
jgi:hypothetical protein